MAKEKIILDKRGKKQDGTFPVKLYIRNRRDFLISTSYYATEENFKDGMFTKKELNYRAKNAILQKMLSSVINEMVILEANETLRGMDDKKLKDHLTAILFGKKETEIKTFIDYLDDFISDKKNKGTIRTYITTKNKIVSFDKKCTFESMDKKWLMSFENWMIENGMKTNAYAVHFRNIRAVFNYAIENDITGLYPFRKFKIKQEETFKRSMSVEQLRAFINCDCEDYQIKYKDLFMLMFYLIGINAGDLLTLKPEDFYNGRIEYHRMKTHKYYSIKVEPEAMHIIDKYKGEKYLLNFMDNNKDYKDILKQMNTQLKLMGKVERKGLGGKKSREPLFPQISTYWSRHTWATIAADLDIPIETISMALGHKAGYKITNVYIKFNQKKIDEANRKVIDYLFKKDKKTTGI